MTETATVTKGMIDIPAAIRRKYGIEEGDKVVFVETERGPCSSGSLL